MEKKHSEEKKTKKQQEGAGQSVYHTLPNAKRHERVKVSTGDKRGEARQGERTQHPRADACKDLGIDCVDHRRSLCGIAGRKPAWISSLPVAVNTSPMEALGPFSP